jgi:hypothetical protein
MKGLLIRLDVLRWFGYLEYGWKYFHSKNEHPQFLMTFGQAGKNQQVKRGNRF